MTQSDIPEEITLLMNSIRTKLHPRAHEIVEGLLMAGERRVAMEHLCEILCEDEVSLDPSSHVRLTTIASLLKLDQRFISIIPKPKNLEPTPE
ncbi:MafI family immunity protein [Cystobacter ferrugineus]|uniref:MafI family immunity protein n=1 Tax=Cystobacter ferrugineus TaxID=83449 RepID=UPI0011611A25|nr:MafI family immunity protein [Cystobacter ferrugineus]